MVPIRLGTVAILNAGYGAGLEEHVARADPRLHRDEPAGAVLILIGVHEPISDDSRRGAYRRSCRNTRIFFET